MNLNRKVNSILGLLLIIITLLGLGIYLFFSYQSPSKFFRESVYSIDYSKMTENKKIKNDTTEVYSAEKACEESQTKLFKNSYLLKDKKHNKDILRLTADSNYHYFTEQASFYSQNICENKDQIVGLNNIFRWKNFLIYSILEENYDCINDKLIAEEDGNNDCQSYSRKIISYDLDTGEEKTLWKKSEIEVPKKDNEGNPTGEMEKQSFSLMRNIELIGDHLYITVHPKNTCYACGYAGWGGFTFRIDLNNPGEEELIGGIGYIGGKIEEHNGNYYIVAGACTEGGCSVGGIQSYDSTDNKIEEVLNLYEDGGRLSSDGMNVSNKIGFWNDYLLVYGRKIEGNGGGIGGLNIYKINLKTGNIYFLFEQEMEGWGENVYLDGDNLAFINNQYRQDFYEKGSEIFVYNLLTNKLELKFEMSRGYSFMRDENRFDGNHSEIFSKLNELGFDKDDRDLLEDYFFAMPTSAGNLLEYYIK